MAVEPKKLGEEFSAGTIIVDKQNHMSLQDKQKVRVGQYGTMKNNFYIGYAVRTNDFGLSGNRIGRSGLQKEFTT
jgi:hypothetical protein